VGAFPAAISQRPCDATRLRLYYWCGLFRRSRIPLTSDLLQRLWPLLADDDFRARLKKVIEFHHHGFDSERFASFPNVEQLMSQMEVNDQFFDMKPILHRRVYAGKTEGDSAELPAGCRLVLLLNEDQPDEARPSVVAEKV
jgi:hypothetical protein